VWWLFAAFALILGLSWLGKRLLSGDAAAAPGAATTDVPPELDYELHIGDELDLHGVRPREVGDLVDAFVEDAHARRRSQVRIIHGKGIGALRELVRARLERHAAVRAFRDAPPPSSWGATVVVLNVPGRDVEADDAYD
jgi:hypothetical protein